MKSVTAGVLALMLGVNGAVMLAAGQWWYGAVPGVTEIRPGNYVFYDRMQVALGSALRSDCALTVLTTVISRPSSDRAVIDAGSKTFALDRGAHGLEALLGYGEDNEFGLVLDRLSEEHGVILLDPAHAMMLQVGDQPFHGLSSLSTLAPSASRRGTAKMSAMVMSAVSSVSTPGVLVTVMPNLIAVVSGASLA